MRRLFVPKDMASSFRGRLKKRNQLLGGSLKTLSNFLGGFTLMEVLIGAIILAASFGGIVAAFTAARSYVSRSNKRLVAANLARSYLNQLYNDVSADIWNSTACSLYPGNYNLGSVTIDGIDYSITYNVTNVTGYDYRQVVFNVTYPQD
jgi:Tfp pilus assembly protein PilV